MGVESNHITTVEFNGEQYVRIDINHALWQYDYGQVLSFDDIELPETYSAFFSKEENGERTEVSCQGNTVEIPDVLLETGGTIYCWIVFEDANENEVEYRVDIPVIQRAEPEEQENQSENEVIQPEVGEKNVIVVAFNGGRYTKIKIDNALWQYDYGQVIVFPDIVLPEVFEVHFSNDVLGKAKTCFGVDNAVSIPDEYLVKGKPVFCWIYLHDGENDGETQYYVEIPVLKRAEITDMPITPQEHSVISDLIEVLTSETEKAEAAAQSASDDKDAVIVAKELAIAAKEDAEAYASVVRDLTSYTQLSDKPSINGVTLQGAMTTADLNISGGSGTADFPEQGSVGDVLMKTGVERDAVAWVTPASDFSGDNTRPVTAAVVYSEIGNINVLLATI